ncbi:MAG: hypothetical protein JWQ71_2342 [Pedosphaera sp.]|nr:hypothetical protein [Pedosphaera sp.]
MKRTRKYGLVASLCFGAAAANASTDYGPANWVANCGQYYSSGNGHKFVVIHDMEGYYASTISYFQNCGTQASVHYCVNGKKDSSSDAAAGEITQMVREANYAWHVICWNQYCWGTEHEGFASNPAWYTDAMYNATGLLQRHLCDVGGIAKDRNHVVGHNAWQSSAWRSYASSAFGINITCNTHTDPGPYWDWSKLMGIINNTSVTTVGPDCVAWADGRIDVMVRGGGNAIFHKYYIRGQGWLPDGGFEEIGGDSASGPGLCSWGPNRLDTFVRGGGDNLYHKYFNGTDWLPDGGWENLGGTINSGPDACSWGVGRIDVVARGGANNIYHKYYNGTDWLPAGGWSNIGGTSTEEPAICTWGSGRLDVFCRGTDNGLYHNYFSSGAWQRSGNWENLGGTLTSGPDACTWGSGRIDVVVRGGSNHIYHKYYSGGNWLPSGGFEDLGGNSTSDPSICTWGSGRLDVFCRGTDKTLQHKYYDNGSWSAWESLGGTLY